MLKEGTPSLFTLVEENPDLLNKMKESLWMTITVDELLGSEVFQQIIAETLTTELTEELLTVAFSQKDGVLGGVLEGTLKDRITEMIDARLYQIGVIDSFMTATGETILRPESDGDTNQKSDDGDWEYPNSYPKLMSFEDEGVKSDGVGVGQKAGQGAKKGKYGDEQQEEDPIAVLNQKINDDIDTTKATIADDRKADIDTAKAEVIVIVESMLSALKTEMTSAVESFVNNKIAGISCPCEHERSTRTGHMNSEAKYGRI